MKKRRKRNISFIVVFLLSILTINSMAQKALPGNMKIFGSGPEWKRPVIRKPFEQAVLISANPFVAIKSDLLQVATNSPAKIYPSDFYVSHLGFFCKKEWEFEKTVHIPLRFRVGSLADCNYLEGKGH